MMPDKISDDAELVRKLKNNDEDAMMILYQNYWRGLYISAFKILKDKEACEDIIQELFIKIWNNRADLNITSSIQGYLSASVRYDVYRKIREVKNTNLLSTISWRSLLIFQFPTCWNTRNYKRKYHR